MLIINKNSIEKTIKLTNDTGDINYYSFTILIQKQKRNIFSLLEISKIFPGRKFLLKDFTYLSDFQYLLFISNQQTL